MNGTAIHTNECSMFYNLAVADESVLLLDYDGTIAPFSVDRDRAFPYSGIPPLLRRVMNKCRTRLVIVSDRRAHELIPLLRIDPLPEIWGTYGLQRIHADGRYEQANINQRVLDIVAQAEADLASEGLVNFIEVKLASVAVHWRGLPPPAILGIRSIAHNILGPLVSQADLLLAEFDGGIAIRPRSANKGNVVRTVLSEIDANVPVAYLGDDITDEDAFRALNGRGLTVRVGPRERFSAAQVWLRYPEELIQFLTKWIRVCGGEQ